MGSLTCDCDEDLLAAEADLPGIECDAGTGGYRVKTLAQDEWPTENTPEQASSIQIDPATGALWAPRQRVIADIWKRNYSFATPNNVHVAANDWQASLPLDYATAFADTHQDTIATGAPNNVTVDDTLGGTSSQAEIFGAMHEQPIEGLLVRIVAGAEVDLLFGSTAGDTLEARLHLQLNGGLQWPFSPTFLIDYWHRTANCPDMVGSANLYGECFVVLRGIDFVSDTVTAYASVATRATGHAGQVLAVRSLWVAVEMN